MGRDRRSHDHVRARRAGKELVLDSGRSVIKFFHTHYWNAEPRCPHQSVTDRTKSSVAVSLGCCL